MGSPAYTIAARINTDVMQSGKSTVIVPQFAAISQSNSGNTTVVAGTANKQIRVLAYNAQAAGATVLTWESSTAGAISGPKSLAANTSTVGPYCPVGLLQTAAGESLILNSSANVSVGGELTYIVV